MGFDFVTLRGMVNVIEGIYFIVSNTGLVTNVKDGGFFRKDSEF